MSDPAPALSRIVAYICELCLGGAGGECHVPGCSFFVRDAPTGDELRWWRSQVEYFSERIG